MPESIYKRIDHDMKYSKNVYIVYIYILYSMSNNFSQFSQ